MAASTRLRTIAVVLAGGVGSRVGLPVPKQLLKIAGKPIIEHTIGVLQQSPEIDDVIVMMTPDYIGDVQRIVSSGGYTKVSAVVPGGRSRNESTELALAAIPDVEGRVLFHDAVRPLISKRIIRECVNALHRYDAVDVAIASADTIIEVDDDRIVRIPDRSRLRRGQTPQGFSLPTIRRAYELAGQDPDFQATDDCGVVLRYLPEVPIYVVEGTEQNIKVTNPVDLFIADKLFQLASSSVESLATSEQYAEQLRGRVAVVFGGSYGIGAEIVRLLQGFGAMVYSFSRSQTGTHVETRDDVEAALEKAFQDTGRIDYVVNTAGVLHTGALAETDDAIVAEMINVNYVAPIQIARLSLRYLQQTKGQLLLFASTSYTRGRAGYSLYSSAKAAVVNITHALADEWSALSVRVNCVNPERTATPMRTRAFGEEPPGTLLDATTVALASIDVLLADVTGQVIDVRRSGPGAGPEADRIAALAEAAEAEAEAEAELGHRTP
jgi:ribitol-5-phosphate 2-dehydrogenase (NADP+) / D-ribitol-5-phosphate cytidylyltransferase